MGHEAFDGGSMHGPPGGSELVEAIGAFSALMLLLVLLALLAVVAYRFVPRLRGGRVDPAEAILRERLARSEISAEEYESTLEVLRSSQAQRMAAEPRNGVSPRSTYEDYVREAMNRLKPGRNLGS